MYKLTNKTVQKLHELQSSNKSEIGGLINLKTENITDLYEGLADEIVRIPYDPNETIYFHTHPTLYSGKGYRPPSAHDLMGVLLTSIANSQPVTEIVADEQGIYEYLPININPLGLKDHIESYEQSIREKILTGNMYDESMGKVVTKWQEYLDKLFDGSIKVYQKLVYPDALAKHYNNWKIPFKITFQEYSSMEGGYFYYKYQKYKYKYLKLVNEYSAD